jgi:hypothetical protein
MFQDMIKKCMTHILEGTATSIFQSRSKSSIKKWYSVYGVLGYGWKDVALKG